MAYSAICLRTLYAMSGADTGYSVICLRAPYAMSDTDLAYSAVCLRACYAMSGTDIRYGATRHGGFSRRVTWRLSLEGGGGGGEWGFRKWGFARGGSVSVLNRGRKILTGTKSGSKDTYRYQFGVGGYVPVQTWGRRIRTGTNWEVRGRLRRIRRNQEVLKRAGLGTEEGEDVANVTAGQKSNEGTDAVQNAVDALRAAEEEQAKRRREEEEEEEEEFLADILPGPQLPRLDN
eukprot:3686428-Rhodomonas_salina.3